MEAAAESLFKSLEQVPDPRKSREVRHSFQAILRLTLLGLVSGQTTMAHIALFGQLHWQTLKEPLGFVRDRTPHATTISRALALTRVCKNEIIATNRPRHPWIPAYAGMTKWAR